MADLDSYYAESRRRADEQQRQKSLIGRYLDDPLIRGTQQAIEAVKESPLAKFGSDLVEGAKVVGTGLVNELGKLGSAGQTLQNEVITPAAEVLTKTLGLELPEQGPELLSSTVSGLPAGTAPAGAVEGVATGLAALPLVGAVTRPAGKLLRPRFNVDVKAITDRALSPAPLAEKVTQAINDATAVLPDADAQAKAKALVRSGGVSRETLTQYAPGTAFLSPAHALAAAEVVTTESRTFLDQAVQALQTKNPTGATAALAQLDRLLNPTVGFSGSSTATAQTLRLVSNPDVKALNLLMERAASLPKGLTPLQSLEHLLRDPAVDPAALGKSVTQTYRNVHEQAQEIVAAGDAPAAQQLLQEVRDALDEHDQLGLFPTPKEVKAAAETYKTVTAQHIVELNRAANTGEGAFTLTPTGPGIPTPKQTTFLERPITPGEQITDDQIREFNQRLAAKQQEQLTLTPTGSGAPSARQLDLLPKPIKPGQQLTDDQLREYNRQVQEAAQERLTLTRPTSGAGSGRGTQQDFAAQDERNRLATIKEHQAQDMRAAAGESAFDAKRTPFRLTPPPGGARSPRTPKQLDLLNLIAQERQPEQLALEMAAAVERPEISTQYEKLIRDIQRTLELGPQKDIPSLVAKLQKMLVPPVKPTEAVQPKRFTTEERKRLQSFLIGAKDRNWSDTELLQAFVADPSLQPDALVQAAAQAQKPTWRDAWQYLIINSILNPAADAVNLFGSATMLPLHVGVRTLAARSGQVSRLLGGKAGVMVGEDDAMLHGLYTSFWDAVKLAGRVAKTGHAEIGPAATREANLASNPFATALEWSTTAQRLAGTTNATDAASEAVLSRAGAVSRALNYFGVATGLPGRLMLSGDQFVQLLASRAEQHAMVYRKAVEQATREGLSNEQFYDAYRPLTQEVARDLPSEIRTAGEAFSLEVTLNQEVGSVGKAAMNLREQANRVTGVLGTLAMPFFKTLVNSTKATWELSPLAPTTQLLGKYTQLLRDDMFGADPVKRDIALGKWALGSMVMSSLVMAGLNGRLRGRGPDNKELRRESIEAQGLPDSFIFNADDGASIQLNRLGVLGNLAGMAADAAEVWLQSDETTRGDLAQLLVTAYVSNLSFDFLMGSSGVLQALANGVKTKEDLDLLAKTVPNFIPLAGTIRSAEKALTPYDSETPLILKDARTTLEKMLARTPGYDYLARQFGWEPVPPLRNQFGYAVRQPRSAFGTEWWNPMYVSGPSKHETLRELATIEVELGMAIAQPNREIGRNGLPMTNSEYDRYQQLAGEQWEMRAKAILPVLRSAIPDQTKRSLIELQLREARQTALKQLFHEQPDLTGALAEQKRSSATTLHTPKKYQRPQPTLTE